LCSTAAWSRGEGEGGVNLVGKVLGGGAHLDSAVGGSVGFETSVVAILQCRCWMWCKGRGWAEEEVLRSAR
jgi:hypothetical protein